MKPNIICAYFSAMFLSLWLGQAAFGHGFVLSLSGNQIEAESEVPTISPHLFVEVFDAFSSTVMFTDHGGVEAHSDFNLPSDKLSLDFLGPLWYSNGGLAQRADDSLTLNATSFDSFMAAIGSIDISGLSMNPGSFPVVGNDAHSIGWKLESSSADAPIPTGVYGFAYRVEGLKDGNPLTSFVPSVPLVVVFSTPDFTGSLNAAQTAIFNAALQGDFNEDGKTTAADINVMLQALTDLNAYQTDRSIPDADLRAIADLDRSGAITNADMQGLLDLLASQEGPQPVPEPRAVLLALAGFGLLPLRPWRRRWANG